MAECEFNELNEKIESLEHKIDIVHELIKAYMDEVNWFVSESAGAIATLKNIYEKKSRS